MTALPTIPAGDVQSALDDVDELRDALDVDDLEECYGGCGSLVAPDPSGLAWCGTIDCAAYTAAEERADRSGRI